MFDVDGTLVQSFEFDEQIFVQTVKDISGKWIDQNWHQYPHVTDTGLLQTFYQSGAFEYSFEELHDLVKGEFVRRIGEHIAEFPVNEILGAKSFFEFCSAEPSIDVSIATGGWAETAILKLESAGFEINDTRLFSSNNHHSRTHIMRMAQGSKQTIYFGDGEWDKKACRELGYTFIAVGDRVKHHIAVKDFSDTDKLYSVLPKRLQQK